MNSIATLSLSALLLAGCREPDDFRLEVYPEPVQRELQFISRENISYSFHLECYRDRVTVYEGGTQRRLHFQEGVTGGTEHPIQEGDYFVLTGKNTHITHVMQFYGLNRQTGQLFYRDGAEYDRKRQSYDLRLNMTTLSLSGTAHQIWVDQSRNTITVDQNGDGLFTGKESPIITIDDKVISESELLVK